VIENRDASEERALSDKCGSYLTEHVAIFFIPAVEAPRKTKIMHLTKKQNNV